MLAKKDKKSTLQDKATNHIANTNTTSEVVSSTRRTVVPIKSPDFSKEIIQEASNPAGRGKKNHEIVKQMTIQADKVQDTAYPKDKSTRQIANTEPTSHIPKKAISTNLSPFYRYTYSRKKGRNGEDTNSTKPREMVQEACNEAIERENKDQMKAVENISHHIPNDRSYDNPNSYYLQPLKERCSDKFFLSGEQQNIRSGTTSIPDRWEHVPKAVVSTNTLYYLHSSSIPKIGEESFNQVRREVGTMEMIQEAFVARAKEKRALEEEIKALKEEITALDAGIKSIE